MARLIQAQDAKSKKFLNVYCYAYACQIQLKPEKAFTEREVEERGWKRASDESGTKVWWCPAHPPKPEVE